MAELEHGTRDMGLEWNVQAVSAFQG